MAFKLPSFNLLRKAASKRVPGVAGSKVGSLGNNRTEVTKTYATRGAARKANQLGLLSRLKPRQPVKPLQPSQPKGLSNRAFGASRTPKIRESFGSYNKRVK
jgi:hypothetical protein